MRNPTRSFKDRLPGYGLAVILPFAAAVASLLFSPVVLGTRSILFVCAAFLATWLGADVGPGLVATVLSTILFDYLFVDSSLSFGIETLRGAVGLTGFVAGNLLITILTASLRRDQATRAVHETELEQRNRELTLLHEITQATLAATELPVLADKVLDAVMPLGPYDLAALRLIDRRTGVPVPLAGRGFRDQANLWLDQAAAAGQPTTARFPVLAEHQPWIAERLYEMPSRLRSTQREGVVSAIVLPMRTRDEILGTLTLGTRTPHHFTAAEVRLLDALGGQVGLAIHTTQLHEDAVRAYAQLKATQEQLLQAQRLETAGRLASQVAHDFNNLLAPLRGYPELMKVRLPAGHPALHYCDQMIAAAQRMAEINDDLLALGRRGHFEQEPLQLASIVHEAVQTIELPPTIRLDVDLGSEALMVKGTAGQLLRTLVNLLVNARDVLTSGGTIRVRVERWRVTEPTGVHAHVPSGEYARLTVADDGPGIPAAVQGQMFEPFVSLKPDGRRGAGLGLSIVKSIVEEHGGVLDFTTNPKEGTTFSVYLPLLTDTPVPPESFILPEGHERILLVEDDPAQRGLLREMLGGLGYRVRAAASGEEALDQAEADPPDLAILDMLLGPGIDGAETYRRLRARQPGLRALLLSGFSETERVRQAQKLGAGPYLQKPVALGQLALVVRRALDDGAALPGPARPG